MPTASQDEANHLHTRLEFDDKTSACIIHFAEDMCDAEAHDVLDMLQNNARVKKSNKFIALIPDNFTACEDFRIQIHRLIVSQKRQDPDFKLAVVTELHQVIGYERFAKLVMQMVDREQIFERVEDALAWLSS
ncbi:MAG: hypothetical protein JW839_03110 [Candidatus Lokiarchaeota archaeon]|nr:hypothetical protein [Candidatus Lokiarchaeota archaeon]